MPLVTNSNGVQTYVSDDDARALAAQLIERIESATRRSEQAGGPLSASAARQVHADFEEAERLLRDTGDMKGLLEANSGSLARFYAPGESERILAERDQLRREAQIVTRAGALLGQVWTDKARAIDYVDAATADRSIGTEAQAINIDHSTDERSLSPKQQDDVVRLKRDQAAGEWVLSGKGPTTRFKTYDLAEAAARRRVGWA